MSSSLKTASFRKTGNALLGVTLLGSLMLTACAPASQTNDSAPNPSASATSEATPAFNSFQSEAFDLSKQVSISVKTQGSDGYLGKGILLGNGVVTHATEEGGKVTVDFTPYEDKDLAWKYTTEVELTTGTDVQLMRWKGNSYLVVSGGKVTTEAASGLTAEKKTQEEHVIVIDAITGNRVVGYKGDAYPLGTSNPDRFAFDPRVHDHTTPGTAIPFITGLVYKAPKGEFKLVDPLTGATVATMTRDYGPTPLNSETGFYKDATTGPSRSTTKSMFGNFAIVSTENTEVAKTGPNFQNSLFQLINVSTDETVSEMKCLGTGDSATKPIYSPDFRYVAIGDQYVFDTKTGKSFCTSPVGNEEMRKFNVSALDNDGNMYGVADKEYLRISLADNTKIETLVSDVSNKTVKPLLITDKGSAVFYSENSDGGLVTVPKKG